MNDNPPDSPISVPLEGAQPEPVAAPTARRDRLLKRREAANLLGVHESTVRRMEKESVLVPVRGPDGVHRFHEEHVRELVVQQRVRTTPAGPEAYDAETAVAVFELFDQEVHPVDVVKQLKLDPRAVAAMHRQWVSMRGGYVVTAEAGRQIAALPWLMGFRRIESGEDLLRCLRFGKPQGPCTKCGDALAEVWPGCALRMAAAYAQ